jgi:hypothetical protein
VLQAIVGASVAGSNRRASQNTPRVRCARDCGEERGFRRRHHSRQQQQQRRRRRRRHLSLDNRTGKPTAPLVVMYTPVFLAAAALALPFAEAQSVSSRPASTIPSSAAPASSNTSSVTSSIPTSFSFAGITVTESGTTFVSSVPITVKPTSAASASSSASSAFPTLGNYDPCSEYSFCERILCR